jgi:hypothetical protein
LDIVQISGENQMELFSMLAVVLWLGNISFSVIDNENHVEVDSNEGTNFPFACLLSVKNKQFPSIVFCFGRYCKDNPKKCKLCSVFVPQSWYWCHLIFRELTE